MQLLNPSVLIISAILPVPFNTGISNESSSWKYVKSNNDLIYEGKVYN